MINRHELPDHLRGKRSEGHYDALASIYDRWLSGDQQAEPCMDFYLREVPRSNGPVLELGVGTGRIAAALSESGVEVVGLDESLEMVTRVSRQFPIVRARFESLPFAECFDTVILPMRTIGHLIDERQRDLLFSEVFRVLRSNGRFLFDHYNFDRSWAQAHNGVPLLMFAGRALGRDDAVEIIWDRYDYDANFREMQCIVTHELVSVGGKVLQSEMVSFPFGWNDAEVYEAHAAKAGFVVERLDGDFVGGPFSAQSDSMVWTLRKPSA